MPTSKQLPALSAPSMRETRSGEQWIQYLEGDLDECHKHAALWVRTKTAEEIENQIALGNTNQYTAIVDGSSSKPVNMAEQNATVFFVSQVLARNLARAKRVLELAVRRVTKIRTGTLATGWTWFLQKGGSSGAFQPLGDNVPSGLTLNPGDALVLAPKAPYAWFVDYKASRAQSFMPRKRARLLGGKAVRRPARGYGFMVYAAKRLRPELRRIGVSVLIQTVTGQALGATKARAGMPILMLVVNKRPRIRTHG